MIKRALLVIVVLTTASIIYLGASVAFPRLLLFPYHAMVGDTPVYSSTPIPASIREVIGHADDRVRTSELFLPAVLKKSVFLTDGGFRWTVLSISAGRAFGLTRPYDTGIIINRSSVAQDRVWNGQAVAGERSLSAVIAHERTHYLIRKRFGMMSHLTYPTWVREGYCDYVAGNSTLSDEAAARMRADGQSSPALAYYDAHRRVAEALTANGGSVETLFNDARARTEVSTEDQVTAPTGFRKQPEQAITAP